MTSFMPTGSQCCHIFTYGPNRGTACGRPVVSEGKCDLCNSREELIFKLRNQGEAMGTCRNEKCDRPALYGGYCSLCLSMI